MSNLAETKHRLVRPARQWKKSLTAQRSLATLDPAETLLLQAIQKGRNDFTFFCEKILGVRVHPGQERVVESLNQKPFLTLAAANSWGKSALIALLTLWASFYKKWADPLWYPYRFVVLGPEMKHSLLVYNEIEGIRLNRSKFQNWGDGKKHRCLVADQIEPFTTPDKHHAFKFKHNGSLMYFESSEERAKAIEGIAPNVVVYDEVRRELYLEFVVNQVILPRGNRVPGFRMMLSSTPLADSFDFMEFVKRGEDGHPDWTSVKGAITENTFLDKEAVELIRRNLDPRVADQVMKGEFVSPEEAYFIGPNVQECMDHDPLPVILDQYKGRALPNHRYVGGIDPAVSEGGDSSAITVWDVTQQPFRVVYEHTLPKGKSVGELLRHANDLIEEYNCIFAFDATGPLGIEMLHQTQVDKPAYYVAVKFGAGNRGSDITSSKRTSLMKQDILGNFRYLINNKLWTAPNLVDLKKELLGYKLDDAHLKTDRLMAQALAAWVAKDYLIPTSQSMTLPNLWDQYTDTPEDDPLYAGGSQLMKEFREWSRQSPYKESDELRRNS